jgi:hypothetical protein
MSPVASKLEAVCEAWLIDLLGLGRERVEQVPVDGQGRMIAGALPALDDHTLVFAQAGNVNTGSFDPFDEICDRVRQASGQLRDAGFRVLNEVVFNQAIVPCDTRERTLATLKSVQESGECWCGGTTWQGEAAIRLSVCSWATTPQDIDRTVAAFVKARG